MTLSNCESLDNLFYDPPEEEESNKFIEAVRILISRNDIVHPLAAASGTCCLRKVKSFNAKQWKINKKQKYVLPAVKKRKNFDFNEQRSLILNLNLWKFIKFINCNSKKTCNKNNTHVNKVVKNDNVSSLLEHKKMDNDQRLENLFWRSWFKAHKRKDIVGSQQARHIKFNDNVEQCVITDDHFIQRLPPARLNPVDNRRPCLQSGLNSHTDHAESRRVFYDYSRVYVANDAIAIAAAATAAATAIISSNNGDHQHKHDVRDVPRNILPPEGEPYLSSVLRVDSELKISNISHHSPAISPSTSSHSTFIFESETDTDTDSDIEIDSDIDTSTTDVLL
ncbi:hypothetical protein SMKI_02G1570 [Saccharomyces mikatae IFO 1815]|uniref:Nitrogen regulatory protein areA GATA-like domain-containing protein n=1 Tax=Saccharomyces mikatae IFO 1815 TaxID=226126 RepID=A0AA35IUP7_SACMI|nr:uncharacterized protein SMKI_02G1570 [Saccharomyces mikatae IFO 1815]CAI4037289.1 hypothetical protein SMKI_02G1570 [Saccharomyces mikatae IFO 1815]